MTTPRPVTPNSPRFQIPLAVAAAAWVGLSACDPQDPATPEELRDPSQVAVDPGPPVMRRLSNAQYVVAVKRLFGDDIFAPDQIEPELRVDGLRAMGSALTSPSPRAVERYEQAAFDIARQALSPEQRDAWLTCDPAEPPCAREALAAVALKAWRRPPTDSELGDLVELVNEADLVLQDPVEALEYGLAAILQSPHFLLRPELGEPDPSAPEGSRLRLTAWELATRLSFLLWNEPPDQELLDAAADGSLLTADGLDAQANRLLADPRARQGVRAFTDDWLHLDGLDQLEKDPTTYVHFTDRLGPSAREETLRVVEHIVFDEDGDLRSLYNTRRTFVDRTLAAVYNLRAPAREGFGEVVFPDDSDRRGLLGQAAFLAMKSHFNSTSPTLRGAFVREHLLCQMVPDPPAGVNTAIPEATEEAATLRDRVQAHMEDPACRSCHMIFDPIGLAAEHYDGVGVRRERDNGVPIDASGNLDGQEFSTLGELADLLFAHPRVPECHLLKLTRYALGRRADAGEQELLDVLGEVYAARDHRLQPLLLDLVQTPMFRMIDPGRTLAAVDEGDEDEVSP